MKKIHLALILTSAAAIGVGAAALVVHQVGIRFEPVSTSEERPSDGADFTVSARPLKYETVAVARPVSKSEGEDE